MREEIEKIIKDNFYPKIKAKKKKDKRLENMATEYMLYLFNYDKEIKKIVDQLEALFKQREDYIMQNVIKAFQEHWEEKEIKRVIKRVNELTKPK